MKTIFVSVTNTTGKFLHLGGKVIAPGDTRQVDASIVPKDLLPKDFQPETEAPPDKTPEELAAEAQLAKITALAAGTVPAVVAELPALSDEELQQLETFETANANRKGVLEAIAADRLRRAQPPA